MVAVVGLKRGRSRENRVEKSFQNELIVKKVLSARMANVLTKQQPSNLQLPCSFKSQVEHQPYHNVLRTTM